MWYKYVSQNYQNCHRMYTNTRTEKSASLIIMCILRFLLSSDIAGEFLKDG